MGKDSAVNREILLSFWKVHILHHASEEPVVGQWMLNELRRHGYDVSPGTMYPLLQRMVQHGWLRCEVDEKGGPHARKYYYLTDAGQAVLEKVRASVRELQSEICDSEEKG